MKVLVTGHAGYIGSVVVEMLREAGHDVTGLDNGLFAECGFPGDVRQVRAIKKDIRDVEPGDLAGIEAVIHLAALCNDPLGDVDPSVTLAINHRASVRLAILARDGGVRRFVFASSCSLYGGGNGADLLNEDAPMRPLTPYAESKVRTEDDLVKLADGDFSPVFLRNATAYGFSPRLRTDVVLNNLVGWAYTTGKIRLMSDGRAWRPIVHVEDISRACLASLTAPFAAIHNQAVNIGINDENYEVRDMATMVGEAVPGAEVEYASSSGADSRNYRVDFTKSQRVLEGFTPAWNARRGIQQLLAAYRERNVDRETLFGPRFTRLQHVRDLRDKGALDDGLRWVTAVVGS